MEGQMGGWMLFPGSTISCLRFCWNPRFILKSNRKLLCQDAGVVGGFVLLTPVSPVWDGLVP